MPSKDVRIEAASRIEFVNMHSKIVQEMSIEGGSNPVTVNPSEDPNLSFPQSSLSEKKTFSWPCVDWKETKKAHVFKADLPRLKKEDVKVELKQAIVLKISGKRKRVKEEETDIWRCVERSSGSFLRSFRFPEKVKADGVTATIENSLLTVKVPKVDRNPVVSINIFGSGDR